MSITVNGSSEAWTKYSDTENKSTYARPAHTNKVPQLVIFSRKTPTRSGSDLGVASFDIKIVNGDDDADGVPREEHIGRYLCSRSSGQCRWHLR